MKPPRNQENDDMRGEERHMQHPQARVKAILAVIEPRRSESVKQALLTDAQHSTNRRAWRLYSRVSSLRIEAHF